MRAIIQRVTKASVTVDGEVISSIGRGLCVLLGISKHDTFKEIEYMVRKILNLRLFDENGQRWKSSVKEKSLEVLCVSQFTLQAVLKGNKPDYHMAMSAELSESFYQKFLVHMRSSYRPEAVKDGKFGAYMQVHIQNDGPVTISLETPPSKEATQKQGKGGFESSNKEDDNGSSSSSVHHQIPNSSDAAQLRRDSDDMKSEENEGKS